MGNGMNKILPGLYIGNFKDARDAEQLSKNKVTHILSVHDSARPMLEADFRFCYFKIKWLSLKVCDRGVKYLCIPAADSPSQNLSRHFKESIKFIHECRLRGEGCLVHCLAGVSRSVTLVTAYIMTVTDFGWEDALHTVRAGRSCANPNLGFQRQLQEFEKHEVHQYRQWLKEEYGESPLQDAEEAKNILGLLVCWLPPQRTGEGGWRRRWIQASSQDPNPASRPLHSAHSCLAKACCTAWMLPCCPHCHVPLCECVCACVNV